MSTIRNRFIGKIAQAWSAAKEMTQSASETTAGAAVGVLRDKVASTAGQAWSAAKAKALNATGETKATTAGAAAGGVVASTAGAHIGIAAFGTAVSGAALLPVVATVGVGAVAGYAAYKVCKDMKAKRSQKTNSACEPSSTATTGDSDSKN